METGEPEGGFVLPKMSRHAKEHIEKTAKRAGVIGGIVLALPLVTLVLLRQLLTSSRELPPPDTSEVLVVAALLGLAVGTFGGLLVYALCRTFMEPLTARKELRSNPYREEIKDARKLRKRLEKHKGELVKKQIAALDEHLVWMIRYADHEQEELGNFAVDTMLPDLESLTRHIYERHQARDEAHQESRELLG